MSNLSLALALALLFFRSFCFGALQYGFYDGKCGSSDVENIVIGVVNSWCNVDATRSAALLRMQFHDCFVKVRKFMSQLKTGNYYNVEFVMNKLFNYSDESTGL